MQRTRLQLLEPEDGLGFQARPRARRASGGDPGLLQHGYGSPEAEPAAVQKARAKLLEPEDSLGFQVAPRLLHQSRSDGDLQPYGRGSTIAPRTRSTSTTPLTSSPTTSQFSRKGSRPSTPQGRQRKAAPKSQISPGVRFLVSSLKQSQALQASRQSITPEVRDWQCTWVCVYHPVGRRRRGSASRDPHHRRSARLAQHALLHLIEERGPGLQCGWKLGHLGWDRCVRQHRLGVGLCDQV